MNFGDLLLPASDEPALPADAWAGKAYLVVDDYAGVRQLLRDCLRSVGAVHIDQADCAADALARLAERHYDVVLCDYHLGDGRNGQQVLEEARVRSLVLPSCVWLMVSAEKSVESVIGAAEHQPDGYLVKPITEAMVVSRLGRVWHRKQVFREIDRACADQDYLLAASLCERQLADNPVHAIDLLRMKAQLCERSGDLEGAQRAYESVLAQRDYQWALAGIARLRMAAGEYAAARDMLRAVIEENRYYVDAYDQLAAACQQLGLAQEACEVLDRAVRLSPHSVQRQRSLGDACLQVGELQQAEKAYRRSIALSRSSVTRSGDAYLGLARVCGLKNDTKEALELLATVQAEFPDEAMALRAKLAEGLVYHESGDYRRARKAGDALAAMLAATPVRPAPRECLDMARLMFVVGVKEAPAELLGYLARNNHDDASLIDEAHALFEMARMGERGTQILQGARQEAIDLMNRGVLLWKDGETDAALAWMRQARARLPDNVRVLVNSAQILLAVLQQDGYHAKLAAEARAVLAHVERVAPGQPRCAQLIDQLRQLGP